MQMIAKGLPAERKDAPCRCIFVVRVDQNVLYRSLPVREQDIVVTLGDDRHWQEI